LNKEKLREWLSNEAKYFYFESARLLKDKSYNLAEINMAKSIMLEVVKIKLDEGEFDE
jgi:hypothetical protein